jgi:hypothetical protein
MKKKTLQDKQNQLKEKLGGLDSPAQLANLDDQLQRYNELIHILMSASFKKKFLRLMLQSINKLPFRTSVLLSPMNTFQSKTLQAELWKLEYGTSQTILNDVFLNSKILQGI